MDREKAINVIKEYYPFSDKELNEAIETYIPDIKVCDEERIRRVLIQNINTSAKFCDALHRCGLDDSDVKHWLERLGEQKLRFKAGDRIRKTTTGEIVEIKEVSLKEKSYNLTNTGFIPFKYEHMWELVEEKHPDMVANLKEYLANTPKEQIEKDWDELKHWNNIGPTVEEFLYGEQKSKAKYIYPKFRIGDVISQKHPDLGTITYTIVGFNEKMPDYLVDGGNVPSCSIGIDFIDKNFTLVNKKSSGCHDGDDEKLINNVIELIDAGSLDKDEKDFYIEKLESLKERVQSNEGWTEEDEQTVRFYEAYTNNQVGNWPQNKVLEMKSKFNDWVKKVKYRVQPQWKPSKEQLTALEHVSSEYIGSWQPEMLTLFDDLKTLYDNYNKSEK